jgi:ABC-type amino acid transport substrate-binding protein
VTGSAAAALTDSISGHLYLREHDGLRLTGPPVTVEPFALVVRIEDERLLNELNESLEELEEEGRIEQIRNRWLYSELLSLFF